MAKVTVDGKAVEVPNGANALEACRAAGVDIPHFCYHPALSIVGQCRMCMVEVEGVPKIQASCTVPVRDGTHSNTAFALGLALDWARVGGDAALADRIGTRARDFYLGDRDCPLAAYALSLMPHA